MYYLKNVRFKVPHTDEEIYFDKGDVEGFYEIINWQFSSNGEISYVIVGHYNGSAAPEDRMNILNDSIVWNSEVLEVSFVHKPLTTHSYTSSSSRSVYARAVLRIHVCYSLLGQCAARTVSRAPGRESARESQSAASTVSHVLMERSATHPVSIQLPHWTLRIMTPLESWKASMYY